MKIKKNLIRSFVKEKSLFLFIFLIFSCDHEEKKIFPNILFAIADDQSFPHASAYGFKQVNSSGFDIVANSGVLFNNAFVGAPQCSPSRASILTGKNIWQIEEAGTHASHFPKKYTVFTDILEESGYQLGYTGKAWAPGNWKIEGWDRNPVGPEFNKHLVKNKKIDLSEQDFFPSGISPIDYFKNFLDFYNNKQSNKPFFFWYGGHEPHRNYEYGSGVKSGKDILDSFPPQFLPDNDVTRNDMLDYLLEIDHFNNHLKKMLEYLKEIGELENTIVIVTADNGMPFPYAKANLQEYGTHVPLAISWLNKITNSKTTNDLVSLIDLAPTILSLVGITNPVEMTGKDFSEILLVKDSKPIRNFVLTGRERHTHARPDNLGYPSRAIRTEKFLYIMNLKPERWPAGDPVPKNSENDLLDKDKKYKSLYPGYHDIDGSPTKTIMMDKNAMVGNENLFEIGFNKRSKEQLYDIVNDPACLNDLSKMIEYTDVLESLKNKLVNNLTIQNDPRMIGSEIFDSYPRISTMRNFQGFNKKGKYNEKYKN
jgi:uncharacterized sulfatase|tara:strand:+ start:9246 stop:10862 length:1617 start_codon:yes stop_codon:yes gene_type:complete